MPVIINKATGKRYVETPEGIEKIKANPMTRKLFTFHETEEPEEVTALKQQQSTTDNSTGDNTTAPDSNNKKGSATKKADPKKSGSTKANVKLGPDKNKV